MEQPSPNAAPILRGAIAEALGLPSLVLFASYVGFGSLVRQAGLGLPAGMLSTMTGWALPGQVALVELYAAGTSVAGVALAVLLTNARLMPMVIVLMPLLRRPGAPRWCYYALSHLVAVTSWANALRRLPDIPGPLRLRWFAAYALTLFVASLVGTAAGYHLAGAVPLPVTLGLIFLNPVYFMLILAADLRSRARTLALALGAVAGPLFHVIEPEYGLLATGLLAGTAAFALDRALPRRMDADA